MSWPFHQWWGRTHVASPLPWARKTWTYPPSSRLVSPRMRTPRDSACSSSDIHQRSAAFGGHQHKENHGIITILILTLLFLLVVLLFLLLHSFHFSSWTSLARSDSRSQQTDRPGQEGRCGSACRTGQSGSPVDLSEPDNETGQCPEDSWKSFESVCMIALVLIVDS